MPEKIRLSDAIQEFAAFRKVSVKPGTRKNDGHVMRRFLLVNGDLFLASIAGKHVDAYLANAAVSRGPSSLRTDYVVLRAFFAWAVRGRYIGRFDDPMEGRRSPKVMPKERQRVPQDRFAQLLDSARDPRDRMVVALGLYLFLRGSEAADLKIRDVNLTDGEISVRVFKTDEVDVMPISEELDRELRRWLTYYTEEMGQPPEREWYLVPAKTSHRFAGRKRNPDTFRWERVSAPSTLRPLRKITQIEEIPQRSLLGIGFDLRDEDGVSLREGMHTLRRSGARARFDHLEHLGHDGAIRHVQTMLHHKTMAQTEGYLGLTLDRVKRNKLVQGKPMFAQPGSNVVQLRGAADG